MKLTALTAVVTEKLEELEIFAHIVEVHVLSHMKYAKNITETK